MLVVEDEEGLVSLLRSWLVDRVRCQDFGAHDCAENWVMPTFGWCCWFAGVNPRGSSA